MKNFMDENFLLQTETAQKLYHEHAAKMPIIDYHCHLIPQMVADDYKFKSLTEIWLGGDHYKWRAMRTNGVDERFCTGKDTTDWEKFEKWAETVPYTFRNPLYHWTHLELKTAFGINKILNPQTAREIYDECNEKLSQPEYSARGMMRRYHVEVVCTTDDPIDSLEYHIKTRESGFEIKMLPTWRPDKAMAVEVPADFRSYVEKLAEVSEEVERSGNEWRWKRHGSVTFRGNRWYRHSQQMGSHAIDFMQEFFGMSYPEAVTYLLNGETGQVIHGGSPPRETAGKRAARPRGEETTEEKEPKILVPPEKNDTMKRVYAYLMQKRHISREVLSFFARNKQSAKSSNTLS